MYSQCQLKPPKITRGYIPKGYPGTLATVGYVSHLIKQGAKDFCVRQTAIDILRNYRIRPKDYFGEIAALFHWVQNNIRYTKDIFKVELLHTARRMLHLRAGDCDDMAILLGAMLEATGHPVRLVIVGQNPRRQNLYSHIYLETQCRGQWIPLDPTMQKPLGWAPNAMNKKVIDLR
jgi:transglutaminase-like putative cysteine protease